MDNLLLLCRRHHRMVHGTDGFGVTMRNGRPVFSRPDGSALPDDAAAANRAPP